MFPYSPAPAGVRITDYSPRRFFNFFQAANFTTARSPAPTPDSSPVKPNIHPHDDPPPTVPLAHLFAGDRFGSPQRPSTPTPMYPPNTANVRRAEPPKPMPMPPLRYTHRKTKHGPKHLSFSKLRRRGVDPSNKRVRRKRVKEHERRMARAHGMLENFLQEATEAATASGSMGQTDKIFLDQLEKLCVDQEMLRNLEAWRQRMARANEEVSQRMQEQEERDEQAEKLWEESHGDAEAEKEQQRKVAELVRRAEEKRAKRFRRMEEKGLRADEERQRAHNEQERKIREEQERLLHEALDRKKEEEHKRREQQERQERQDALRRACEEMKRKRREEMERQLQEEILKAKERQLLEEQARRYREQVEFLARKEREQREEIERLRRERLAREAQERILREQQERFSREQERIAREQERIAREQQARLAREHQERLVREQRTAQEEQVRTQFVVYEAKWQELRTSTAIPPIGVHEMPWPVLGVVSSAEQITYQDVRAFLFHPLRPDVQGKSARDRVKLEVLRFHPDKFDARVVPRIQEAQRAVAKEIAGAIARILTRIMAEAE